MTTRTTVVLGVAALVAACGGTSSDRSGPGTTTTPSSTRAPATISVTSNSFADGAAIPRANTCDGPGAAPQIAWRAVPAGTASVALVVDDPDAPGASPFVHWLVIDLLPRAGHLPDPSAGGLELANTAGTTGWTPPCPPPGTTHHYRFTVYALSGFVCAGGENASGCTPPQAADARAQIQTRAIAKGVLAGTYRR